MFRPVEAGVEADPEAGIDLLRPFEQAQNLAWRVVIEKRRDMHITRCGYVFREHIEVLPDVTAHRVVRARVGEHHSIGVVYVRQAKTAKLLRPPADPVMGDAEFVHLIDKRQSGGLDSAENPEVREPDTPLHLREAENRQPRRPAKRVAQRRRAEITDRRHDDMLVDRPLAIPVEAGDRLGDPLLGARRPPRGTRDVVNIKSADTDDFRRSSLRELISIHAAPESVLSLITNSTDVVAGGSIPTYRNWQRCHTKL